MDPITTGLGIASIAGGLFGKKKKMPKLVMPDISGELAKLDQLYAQQGELLKQSTMGDIARAQKQAASGLAARGIYSSPVSQKSLGEVSRAGLQALASGQAGLLGQQATARTSALNNLLGYQQAAQRANAEIALQKYAEDAATRQGLLGIGGGLLRRGSMGETPQWWKNIWAKNSSGGSGMGGGGMDAYGSFRSSRLNAPIYGV